MKARVYLEITIISYYSNSFSSNLVVAGRQQITRYWWDEQSRKFDAFVSPLVIKEVAEGDLEASRKRLNTISDIPVLEVNSQCEQLAGFLLGNGHIPQMYPEDALHIAIAAVHQMDFLLTWNFAHINNVFMKKRIYQAIEAQGFACPNICSPEELTEE